MEQNKWTENKYGMLLNTINLISGFVYWSFNYYDPKKIFIKNTYLDRKTSYAQNMVLGKGTQTKYVIKVMPAYLEKVKEFAWRNWIMEKRTGTIVNFFLFWKSPIFNFSKILKVPVQEARVPYPNIQVYFRTLIKDRFYLLS